MYTLSLSYAVFIILYHIHTIYIPVIYAIYTVYIYTAPFIYTAKKQARLALEKRQDERLKKTLESELGKP